MKRALCVEGLHAPEAVLPAMWNKPSHPHESSVSQKKLPGAIHLAPGSFCSCFGFCADSAFRSQHYTGLIGYPELPFTVRAGLKVRLGGDLSAKRVAVRRGLRPDLLRRQRSGRVDV
jgi:hypothetical protein